MSAVLLVPGWSDRKTVLRPLEKHLLAAGWPRTHVRALGFRDRFGGNIEHAHEVADAVERLCHETRSEQVAVVAHSTGGFALRWYLTRLDGARRVCTAIFLATPMRGSWLAWLAFGQGARELRPDSLFLRDLHSFPMPPSVRTVCIRSPLPYRFFPSAAGLVGGARVAVIRTPGQPGMLRSPRVFRAVVEHLLQDHHT